MLDSPNRLAALTAASGVLSSILFGIHLGRSGPVLLLCFALLVASTICMYWASFTLREGVSNERWPEERILRLRRITQHAAWKSGMWLLLLAMMVALVKSFHHSDYFWSFFLLTQTISQLSMALARPRKSPTAGARLDWSQVLPLRSEHWGER